jgi:hypothetical protein
MDVSRVVFHPLKERLMKKKKGFLTMISGSSI